MLEQLTFAEVIDDVTATQWREVHNLIIPTAPLSLDEVGERSRVNHLEVAYVDGTVVGCSTVRAPDDGVVTVIARVLPEFRRRGIGERMYQRCLERAARWGATGVVTVVLESNVDGLRFAIRHGFVEFDRYVLPGDTAPFIDLRLETNGGGA